METKNSVVLLGFYGGDKTHCLSAWQSTNLDFEYTQDINSRIQVLFANTTKTKKKSPEDLLKMLADHGHHTPFEKSTLHFQLTDDVASHIHCLKHRIAASINAESARYKELQDKWHIPDDWNIPVDQLTQSVKLSVFDNSDTWADILFQYVQWGHELYHEAIHQLTPFLGRKRAKESARYFLTYAKQIDHDMMFNFRSFVHFQQLRNSDDAQKEIRDIAHQMLVQVQSIPGNPFEHSLSAFGLV